MEILPMKLWSGRLTKSTDELVHQLNSSLSFDIRLYNEDIDGSLAWSKELIRAGVLSEEECATISEGLEEVRREFKKGAFEHVPTDEDIHTAVERRLTELIGPVAGKLHTGRSRNDQVATDFRLWVIRAVGRIDEALVDLAQALLESAEGGLEFPMPGYTHLQRAQPVTWGHWVLSRFWPLIRDRERFAHASSSAAVLPLGSGAIAGTTFPIDRQVLATELGFNAISSNSMDAVADRDFALEFLFAAAVLSVHLSSLAETLILFSSTEFGFIELDDAYATGSSLMPQKKNPDPLEIARGKSGRLIGHLTGLLSTLKGLPSAYDKDLQEDKEPVFDAHDTLVLLLPVLSGLIRTLRIYPERMMASLTSEMLATDMADYLVHRGVPFRQAHELVSRAARLADEQGISLPDLPLEDLRILNDNFGSDVVEVFDVERALARRTVDGGTSPAALRSQREPANKALE
jgi:argininosuccinate lyase